MRTFGVASPPLFLPAYTRSKVTRKIFHSRIHSRCTSRPAPNLMPIVRESCNDGLVWSQAGRKCHFLKDSNALLKKVINNDPLGRRSDGVVEDRISIVFPVPSQFK